MIKNLDLEDWWPLTCGSSQKNYGVLSLQEVNGSRGNEAPLFWRAERPLELEDTEEMPIAFQLHRT